MDSTQLIFLICFLIYPSPPAIPSIPDIPDIPDIPTIPVDGTLAVPDLATIDTTQIDAADDAVQSLALCT